MTTELNQLVRVASVLSDAGLARTARRFLRHHRTRQGYRLNALRREVQSRALSPGIQPGLAALTLDSDLGLVVPLTACREARAPRDCFDAAAREALGDAWSAAKELVEGSTATEILLQVMVPEVLRLEGRSLGLAAALAFVARLLGKSFDQPILATGGVTPAGVVVPIDGAAEKLEAAKVELEGTRGLVLAHPADAVLAPPGLDVTPVRSVVEAVTKAICPRPWRVEPSLLTFQRLLEDANRESNHERAIRLLESAREQSMYPADRARLLVEKGIRQRHLGRTAEAHRCHAEALSLFEAAEPVLGRAVLETFEMELLATEMDHFRYRLLEERLRERLDQSFAILHNEVRCRGMLAQILSSTNRPAEALELRRANLEFQERSEAMAEEIPRTLCAAVWAAALAGDGKAFDDLSTRLFESTLPGDNVQVVFNEASIVRGLVVLGRCRRALDWAAGKQHLVGHEASDSLRSMLGGEKPVVDYPQVSTARALIRALRREGSPRRAETLAKRVHSNGDTLITWLAELAVVEGALAVFDRGERDAAEVRLSASAGVLETSHSDIARSRKDLLRAVMSRPLDAATVATIERELDSVYY